jgi:hypothetical protein
MEMEDEVDLVMYSDIVAAQLSTKTITFTREKAGWIWKEDRAQKVIFRLKTPLYGPIYILVTVSL